MSIRSLLPRQGDESGAPRRDGGQDATTESSTSRRPAPRDQWYEDLLAAAAAQPHRSRLRRTHAATSSEQSVRRRGWRARRADRAARRGTAPAAETSSVVTGRDGRVRDPDPAQQAPAVSQRPAETGESVRVLPGLAGRSHESPPAAPPGPDDQPAEERAIASTRVTAAPSSSSASASSSPPSTTTESAVAGTTDASTATAPGAVSVLERPSAAPEAAEEIEAVDDGSSARPDTARPRRRRNLRRMAGILPTVVSVLLVAAMWMWVAGDRGSDAGELAPDVVDGTTLDPAPDAAGPEGGNVSATGPDEAPAPDGRAGAPADTAGPGSRSSAQGPEAAVAPAPWYPVVEVLDGESTDRAAAEERALAVTALGYPVTAVASEQVDGLEPGDWVLVGEPRGSLDDAVTSCEGLSLLPTCAANRLVD